MGSPPDEEGRDGDEDQVELTLSRHFWLAKTVVTQAQWEAVMSINPSSRKGADFPVDNVNWTDAQAFIARLNEQQILPPDWQFALPTEAQWEYACRAGERGPYSGGTLDVVGWYDGNSGGELHTVGQKNPNSWGLYDMHGNVWEWCSDEKKLQGEVDSSVWREGILRVVRGGDFMCKAVYCRAANHDLVGQFYRSANLGFRPALVPSR
jgi:formylglycine-generating enzyme required for sulfatase activity